MNTYRCTAVENGNNQVYQIHVQAKSIHVAANLATTAFGSEIKGGYDIQSIIRIK